MVQFGASERAERGQAAPRITMDPAGRASVAVGGAGPAGDLDLSGYCDCLLCACAPRSLGGRSDASHALARRTRSLSPRQPHHTGPFGSCSCSCLCACSWCLAATAALPRWPNARLLCTLSQRGVPRRAAAKSTPRRTSTSCSPCSMPTPTASAASASATAPSVRPHCRTAALPRSAPERRRCSAPRRGRSDSARGALWRFGFGAWRVQAPTACGAWPRCWK